MLLTKRRDQESLPTSSDLSSNGLFIEKGRAADEVRNKIVADTREKFMLSKNDRWRQERQWYMNLSFYFGQQWVQFRTTESYGSLGKTYDLYTPTAPYYRVRPTINHTRRIIRKEISRLTAQKPNAYVVPASPEDQDIFAAQAGEAIWDSMWRRNKLNSVVRKTAFWTSTCGNGFINQFWDETAEDRLSKQKGDIVFHAITPFNIFIADLKEEDIEGQPFVFNIQMKSLEYVKNVYGVEAVNAHSFSNMVDESLLNVLGANQFSSRESVPVVEAWYKPYACKYLPEGGMVTMAADQIVGGWEGWPLSHGQFPFSKVDNIPTGKFYTESLITDLIPLQRELNRTRGQIIEAKNRTAKPQLVAENGSVDPTAITTEPGQVILFRSGYNPPTPLPLQDLPTYVTEEVNRLYTDMADIAGQHEVSQGTVPPGVTAATAISYLQEQDESMLSTMYDSLEEALEKTAYQTLNYVKDYWEIARVVKYTGVDGTFDVRAFKGSELRDNTDIKVEAGSALPTSRAAKQAFIMDLMKMGFIPPQEGLEVMEIGGINKIYERLQVDVRQAQRENLKMRSVTDEFEAKHIAKWEARVAQNPELGIDPETKLPLGPPLIVPVNTWDNHMVHIEMHNRHRKSQAFETAPDVVKRLFEEHVKQHQEAIMVGTTGNVPPDMMDPLQPPEGIEEPVPLGEQQQAQPGPAPIPQLEGEL